MKTLRLLAAPCALFVILHHALAPAPRVGEVLPGPTAHAAPGAREKSGRTLAALAPVGIDSARARGAAAAEAKTSLEGARGLVSDLAVAIAEGDPEAASAIVERWYADGADAFPLALEHAARLDLSPGEVKALGVLFRAGAHFLTVDAASFDPWTLDDFVRQSTDLLGAANHVPSVLFAGFSSSGSDLDPSLLRDLLSALRTRDVGPASTSQFSCLTLAKTWAATMAPGVEPILLGLAASSAAKDESSADAAAMLLTRDWRRHLPSLVDALSRRVQAGPARSFEHVMAAHIEELDYEDQAEYFGALSSLPDAAVSMSWLMDAAEAASALDILGTERLSPFAQTLLIARSGRLQTGDDAFALLEQEMPSRSRSALESLVVRSALVSDAAFEEGFDHRLLNHFSDRGTGLDRLFRIVLVYLPTMSDAHVAAAVLPLVESEEGARSSVRTTLVADINRRFPELQIR